MNMINYVIYHVDLLNLTLEYYDQYKLKDRYTPRDKRTFVILIAASGNARRHELKFINKYKTLNINNDETRFMDNAYVDYLSDEHAMINFNVRPVDLTKIIPLIEIDDKPNYQYTDIEMYIDYSNSLRWYVYNKERDHLLHICAYEMQNGVVFISAYSNYNNYIALHKFTRVDIFIAYMSEHYPYSFMTNQLITEMEQHGLTKSEIYSMANQLIDLLNDLSSYYDDSHLPDMNISIMDDYFYKSKFYIHIVDFDCACMNPLYVMQKCNNNCMHKIAKDWDNDFEFNILSHKNNGRVHYQNKIKFKKRKLLH